MSKDTDIALLEKETKILLQPCKNKKELKAWIKRYLNLELPDVTVSRFSDTNPLNVIWEVYNICVNKVNPDNIQELLFVAGRGSGKTLGMAIAELMILLHDKRDIAHVGAIQTQAERCYAYQKNFLYNKKLKPLVTRPDLPEDIRILEKANMSKSIFNVGFQKVTLEVLPCTLKACVDPNSIVKTKKYGYKTIDSVNVGEYIASIDTNSEKISLTYRKVLDVWTKFSETYRITFNDGSIITGGSDNKILSDKGWIELQDINTSSRIVVAPQFKKLYGESNFKWQPPMLNLKQWRSALVGMMLGDASISRNKNKKQEYVGNARLYKSHSEKQLEYLLYCRDVISLYTEIKQIRSKVSGFGSKMHELITSSSDNFNFLIEAFYSNNSNKKTISPLVTELLDEVGLAFWVQDDGCLGPQIELSVCGFTDKDCEQLIYVLQHKFNLKSAHIRESHEYNVIRLSSNDSRRLKDIIKPYVHPSMFYKLSHLISPKVYSFEQGNKVDISTIGRSSLLNETLDGKYSSKQFKQKFMDMCQNYITPVKIEFLGKRRLIDIEVEGNDRTEHSFLTNGIISAQCNGPHVPLVVVDEIDTVSGEGLKAFKEISGMLDSKANQKALRVGISTRKTRYGLMNQKIEEMESSIDKTRVVKKWTAFEFTEKCPDSRSGTKEIELYVNQDKMDVVSIEDFLKKDKNKQKEYSLHKAYEGCAKCPLFSICLTDAKKQTSKSPMLKTIDELVQKVRSEGADWALAQLMNLKPSVEGIVFREFDDKVHVKTWNQMWFILTGKEYPGECTHDMFVKKCHDMQIPCYAGIDWGFSAPNTVVYFFGVKRDNIYVVRCDGMTYIYEPTLIHHLKVKYNNMYRCQLYVPDAANQGAIQEMQKAGLPVANQTDKGAINSGIQVVKKFLKVPGTNEAKLFLAKEFSQPLVNEFMLYHYKMDAAGLVTDTPDTEFDHWLDALRYPMTMLFGKSNLILGGGLAFDSIDGLMDKSGNFNRMPTPSEYAMTQGLRLKDSEPDLSKLGKIGKISDIDDDPGDDSTGGEGSFLWSF